MPVYSLSTTSYFKTIFDWLMDFAANEAGVRYQYSGGACTNFATWLPLQSIDAHYDEMGQVILLAIQMIYGVLIRVFSESFGLSWPHGLNSKHGPLGADTPASCLIELAHLGNHYELIRDPDMPTGLDLDTVDPKFMRQVLEAHYDWDPLPSVDPTVCTLCLSPTDYAINIVNDHHSQ